MKKIIFPALLLFIILLPVTVYAQMSDPEIVSPNVPDIASWDGEFRWIGVPDANQYQIFVYIDDPIDGLIDVEGFTLDAIDACDEEFNCHVHNANTYTPGPDYTWYVKACNTITDECSAQVWGNFSLLPPPTATPEYVSPTITAGDYAVTAVTLGLCGVVIILGLVAIIILVMPKKRGG